MPMHGIARNGQFEVADSSDTSISMQLMPSEEGQAAYPFAYSFLVNYNFDMLSLEVEFILENLGDQKIPWSSGHHFYFTLPWQEGLLRGNYRIILPGCKAVYHAADGSLVPTDFKGGGTKGSYSTDTVSIISSAESFSSTPADAVCALVDSVDTVVSADVACTGALAVFN